ncbi:hypothetical protein EON65_16910 [archaeon]|nr:MAG: hypothetical protein EON65_16910 [archaeon]
MRGNCCPAQYNIPLERHAVSQPYNKMTDKATENDLPSLGGYLSSRVLPSATAVTLYGMSVGYISGAVSLPVAFYSYAALGALSSVSFFGTAYGIRALRKEVLKTNGQDDSLNYAISGGLHAAVFSTIRYGWKRGIFGAALGTAFGGLFYTSASYLYQESRAAWIEYRRYMIDDSEEKIVYQKTPIILSSKRSVINLTKGSITTVDTEIDNSTSPSFVAHQKVDKEKKPQ